MSLGNCTEAFRVSQSMVDNCSTAYTKFQECAASEGVCDYKKMAIDLQALEKQKLSLQSELQRIISEMGDIVSSAK